MSVRFSFGARSRNRGRYLALFNMQSPPNLALKFAHLGINHARRPRQVIPHLACSKINRPPTDCGRSDKWKFSDIEICVVHDAPVLFPIYFNRDAAFLCTRRHGCQCQLACVRRRQPLIDRSEWQRERQTEPRHHCLSRHKRIRATAGSSTSNPPPPTSTAH